MDGALALWHGCRNDVRPEAERLAKELAAVWDAFVRGQFTMALLVGLMVWVTTAILGVRNSPALGLLSGVAEFVPGVGPVIAGMIGTLIALIFGSNWLPIPNLWFAALVGLFYILQSQFEGLLSGATRGRTPHLAPSGCRDHRRGSGRRNGGSAGDPPRGACHRLAAGVVWLRDA